MGTRAAALKRWRKRGERQRMSRLMRSRYHPKLKVGTTVELLRRDLPAQVIGLLDTLANEALEVAACTPMRANREDLWRIHVIDGNDIALNDRYYPLVREHQLTLYKIHSRPLSNIGGVSVVLFVGLPKGVSE